jgi:acetyl esterase
LKLTLEEKLEIAKKLRATNVVEPFITPEYEKYMNFVDKEEKHVLTTKGDSRIIIITPKVHKKRYPLFIHMHGGGFVRGYTKRDTIFCSMIASTVGCKVIDIDYCLAPENPFPSALNECYDIVKWAFENADDLDVDKHNIALGGDSAGGNLTAAIALIANQNKEFKLKLQILDYPFLDAVTDSTGKVEDLDSNLIERARAFNTLYLEKEEDKYNPLVSLVCAKKNELLGLPPALVITAGKDSLRYEAEKYCNMMIKAGVEVKIKRFLKSNHGFTVNCLDEFEEAQQLIVETLIQVFNSEI